MDFHVLGGWIGGIVGGGLGILGGVFGTWMSIRNTRGPRERAFMIKAAIACWLLVGLLLAGLFLIPRPYGFLLFIPYAILLVWGIRASNTRQRQLQIEEALPRN